MNHADVKGHLADYLEGELSLDQRALVDAHLDDCGECAREVDEMQRTIRLLRMLPEPVTPPMMAANVMRRIRAGESEPHFFERIGRMFGNVLESSFVLPASAIAVASLVIAVVQNPDVFSNVNLAALTGMSTAPNTDTNAAIEVPFVGSLEGGSQPRGPMPVARVGGGEAYMPFTIQIGGMFPRQRAVSGIGRAPRVLETRATNVAGNQTANQLPVRPGRDRVPRRLRAAPRWGSAGIAGPGLRSGVLGQRFGKLERRRSAGRMDRARSAESGRIRALHRKSQPGRAGALGFAALGPGADARPDDGPPPCSSTERRFDGGLGCR